MIPEFITKPYLRQLISRVLEEDLGDGDHSTLSCIPDNQRGLASLMIKDSGIIAGLALVREIYKLYDNDLQLNIFTEDGAEVKNGDVVMQVEGYAHTILSTERVVLNCLQRMSGVATLTRDFVTRTEGYKVKILDTRKTMPGLRHLDKWAVAIGGGENHRIGLYDMIMLKDNHIDFAGGITLAVERAQSYLKKTGKSLKIEVETRNLEEVKEALHCGADIIMLDNMSIEEMQLAVDWVAERVPLEASGNVHIGNVRAIAATGVDFISVGSLTHSAKSLDMSLKAKLL
ncbi:MAG: carboxylating nicotinate-nucleotide diphosphorylase [Cyclobacteriaceae bacterium]|nr:carboxylating nicotinate-nucleotide diphosphorylase [Cyclobacteriaceae bacterium]